MKSEMMDQLFILLWAVVVPIVMLTFLFGRLLSAIIIVVIIGVILNGRYKVRQMELYKEAVIQAAKIAARERDFPTRP